MLSRCAVPEGTHATNDIQVAAEGHGPSFWGTGYQAAKLCGSNSRMCNHRMLCVTELAYIVLGIVVAIA